MSEIITVFKKNSNEYKKLECAAQLLNCFGDGTKHRVAETYFDFGQDWKWTTILAGDEDEIWGEYQALRPSEQEAILLSENIAQLCEAVRKVIFRKGY